MRFLVLLLLLCCVGQRVVCDDGGVGVGVGDGNGGEAPPAREEMVSSLLDSVDAYFERFPDDSALCSAIAREVVKSLRQEEEPWREEAWQTALRKAREEQRALLSASGLRRLRADSSGCQEALKILIPVPTKGEEVGKTSKVLLDALRALLVPMSTWMDPCAKAAIDFMDKSGLTEVLWREDRAVYEALKRGAENLLFTSMDFDGGQNEWCNNGGMKYMEAFGAEVLRRMREHENMRSRKGPAEQVEEQTVEQIKRKLQENLERKRMKGKEEEEKPKDEL